MDESTVKTLRFFDVENTDHLDNDILAFSAILNIAEAQLSSNGGINFELILEYGGNNSVAIHNPLYFIQYSLADSNKTRLFNNRKPPILLIHRQGPLDATSDFSFEIVGIRKDGQNLNIEEQANAPTLAFSRSDKQRYFLKVSGFINEQTRQREDIPEGKYQLEVTFSIVEAGSNGKSRTLKAQDIAISIKNGE